MRKVFFLHIPKTGGTSINKAIIEALGYSNSIEHAENTYSMETTLFSDYAYVSGHIPFPRVEKKIKKFGFKPVTVIRKPSDHIISHISWVRNLKSNNRFLNVPSKIKKLCEYLLKINYSEERDVRLLVDKLKMSYQEVFDNRQVRYFSDPSDKRKMSLKDFNFAVRASSEFIHIGNFECLEETKNFILKQFEDFRKKEFVKIHNENSENKKIELTQKTKDIFENSIKDFLVYDQIFFKNFYG